MFEWIKLLSLYLVKFERKCPQIYSEFGHDPRTIFLSEILSSNFEIILEITFLITYETFWVVFFPKNHIQDLLNRFKSAIYAFCARFSRN